MFIIGWPPKYTLNLHHLHCWKKNTIFLIPETKEKGKSNLEVVPDFGMREHSRTSIKQLRVSSDLHVVWKFSQTYRVSQITLYPKTYRVPKRKRSFQRSYSYHDVIFFTIYHALKVFVQYIIYSYAMSHVYAFSYQVKYHWGNS